MKVTVLAGGVGAARFLRGLVRVVDPLSVTAIVNVADDIVLHGLRVSPDLDTVVYTLAGAIDDERGWGLGGETWQAMDTLRRLGSDTWFNLGDRDLGTHLHRTSRLRAGDPLSEITADLARSWGVDVRILPVTDDPVATIVTIVEAGSAREVGFQDYFVGRQHAVPVTAVHFQGADAAVPAPGVLAAVRDADVVVIAPSNPLVSIGPVLAVPGVRAAVEDRRDRTVAVSPIVAGAALKGPADRMLRELGHEASVVGVARLYAPLCSVLVVDEADAELAGAVEAEGVGCVVAPTVMRDPTAAAQLARTALAAIAQPGH